MYQDLIKTNIPGYMKDKKTGVIINTNVDQHKQAIAARNSFKEMEILKRQITSAIDKIERAIEDIALIKQKIGLVDG